MRLSILLSCILLSVFGFSQYQQNYQYIHPNRSTFEDVVLTKNGCVTAGFTSPGVNQEASIIALDSNGSILWQDTISLNSFGFALGLGRDTSGNIYVGGHFEATNGVNDIFCKKYGPTGSEMWVRIFDSPGNFNPDDFGNLIVDKSQDVVVVGSGRKTPPYTNPLLLHYNSNGNLIKDTTFIQTGSSNFLSAKAHPTGIFAVSKKAYGTQKSTTLHRFNSQYQLGWSTVLPMFTNGGKTILALNPSGYTATGGQSLIIGEAVIGVCRPNGDTVFTRTVSTPTFPYGQVINVLMDSTKFIYVLSRHGNTNVLSQYDTSGTFYWNDSLPRNNGNSQVQNQDILHYSNGRLFYASAYLHSDLVVYDTAGNRLQRTRINLPGLTQTTVTRLTADSSGVYLSGTGRSGGNQYQGFVAHFSDTSSFVSQPNSLGEKEINEVSIYPSPAEDYISIKHTTELIELWIYDINGKMVIHLDKPTHRIDIKSLSAGSYFLKARDEQQQNVLGSFSKK